MGHFLEYELNGSKGNVFPKIQKWLIPITKDKRVIYSKLSFKLWKEEKYAISII